MPVALAERPKSLAPKDARLNTLDITDEVVVFCPKCMTMETLFFTREGLLPTRKFHQVDNKVYHDCGSRGPCRFYRIF